MSNMPYTTYREVKYMDEPEFFVSILISHGASAGKFTKLKFLSNFNYPKISNLLRWGRLLGMKSF